MDAFDADVLIYAASHDHPAGPGVRLVLERERGIGSVLLLPELLSKPLRLGHDDETRALGRVLRRLDLHPVDRAVAERATVLAARYRLRAADATHLATAILHGADRFVTNNHKDFRQEAITELRVTYPDDLT